MTFFIEIPVHMQDVAKRFLFFEINDLLNRLLEPRRGKVRVTVICDDFATYGAPPAVERAIAVSRAFGIQLWPILQDHSQLEARYPRSSQTFYANAGVRHFMTPQDQKTAQYVSEQLGVTQVSTWQKSVNFDPNDDVKEGWTCPPTSRPLQYPHEVRACPADRMFVFVRGLTNAIYARRIPYFKQSQFRGKYRPNPFLNQSLFSRIFR